MPPLDMPSRFEFRLVTSAATIPALHALLLASCSCWLSVLGFWHPFLAGGGDIVSVAALKDFFGALRLLAIVGVDRDQNVSCLDFSFIAFGFIFGHPQADQGATHAAYSRADRCAT